MASRRRLVQRFAFASRAVHHHRLHRRPVLEVLEGRVVLSTFTVNSLGDAGNGSNDAGDLRYCIDQANANDQANTIVFDSTLFSTPQTITLSGGQLELEDTGGTQTITGPTAGSDHQRRRPEPRVPDRSWPPESVIVWGRAEQGRIEDDRVRLVIGVGLVDAVPEVARVVGTVPRIPQAVDGERGQHDPALEDLQDRVVLSTFTVNSLGDAGNGSNDAGDLRYCIDQANANDQANTIVFDSTLFSTPRRSRFPAASSSWKTPGGRRRSPGRPRG